MNTLIAQISAPVISQVPQTLNHHAFLVAAYAVVIVVQLAYALRTALAFAKTK